MTAIAGKTGTVDGVCGAVKGWTVTISTDMLDATNFCSEGWREFVEGLQGATGTLTSTERFSGSVTLTLANNGGGVSISGTVWFNDETFTNEVDGIFEYGQSFTFTGEVTVA